MKNKKFILEQVVDYYLHSPDFNGLPINELGNYDNNSICSLINERLIEILSETDYNNPHVRCFPVRESLQHQKECVNTNKFVVLYPTDKALAGIDIDYKAPYTERMRKGAKQFDVIYFDIEMLERYANNPNFVVSNSCGYRGTIYPSNDSNSEEEYIRDFGMAYIGTAKLNRAIGVFVSDLAKLPARMQSTWRAFELEKQDDCWIAPGFKINLIEGEWTKEYWIFEALLEEIRIINKQCKAMNIHGLFHKEYEIDSAELSDYRYIYLPTRKNYFNFVLILEKIVVSNINQNSFFEQGAFIKPLAKDDEQGKAGTITLLKNWLDCNVNELPISMDDEIINPLREIRKLRQAPAHEIKANEYNIDFYQKQCDLMKKIYNSVRTIRLIFMNHPLAKSIEIPEQIYSGKDIVNF